jgi:hypothetical protein
MHNSIPIAIAIAVVSTIAVDCTVMSIAVAALLGSDLNSLGLNHICCCSLQLSMLQSNSAWLTIG